MIEAVELSRENVILRGMLRKPQVNAKMPMAIFFHGFTGSKHETHSMFAKASRIFEQHGIASLRFDFAGSGESDGEFYNMTFSSEVSDAEAILKYAKSLDFVDKNNMFVVGLSMGGAVASVVASKHHQDVKKLCLWAPAGSLYSVLNTIIKTQKGDCEFDKNKRIDLAGNVISKNLLDELENMDLFESSKNYKNATLIIHGDMDIVVPIENAYKYKDVYGDNAQLHIVKGANHTFDSEYWESEVISKTLEFLQDVK